MQTTHVDYNVECIYSFNNCILLFLENKTLKGHNGHYLVHTTLKVHITENKNTFLILFKC